MLYRRMDFGCNILNQSIKNGFLSFVHFYFLIMNTKSHPLQYLLVQQHIHIYSNIISMNNVAANSIHLSLNNVEVGNNKSNVSKFTFFLK